MKSTMQKSLLACVMQCEKRSRRRLIIKYEEFPSFYSVKVINDIIFNEESHFVAVFKEYLIYEEINEFFKRFYTFNESSFKIVRILQFFEKYSKIYPNYTKLPESKYIYKNIKRKQKMIDLMQENSDSDEVNSNSDFSSNSNIFTTHAMQSINSMTQSMCQKNSMNENDSIFYQVLLNKENNNSNNDDSISGIDSILNKIKEAEGSKAFKKKDIIGVLKKNINEINVFSPKIKLKLHDIKTKIFDTNNLKQLIRLPNKIKTSNENTIATANQNGDSLVIKIDKMLLTTNTGNSICKSGLKSDRISNSTSTNRKPMNYTTANSLNKRKQTIKHQSTLNSKSNSNNNNRNIINGYNSNANSNINHHCNSNNYTNNNSKNNTKNSINNNTNKNSITNVSTQIVTNTKSKIFSPRNSIHVNYPHTQNTSLDKKSRSISKNNSIINNVNIINHVQSGSTQINIYNGTDLLKSLRLNANQKSSLQYSTVNNSRYNKKELKKPHPKFELNLRKIIHKNMIEVESVSDRNGKMNFFDKLGMNFLNEKKHNKMNSMALTKNNLTENKYNNRIFNNSQNKNLTRQNSLVKLKKLSNVINPNSNNTNSNTNTNNSNTIKMKLNQQGNTNIKCNLNQNKLKNLYEMNKFLKQKTHTGGLLSSQIHSERNKKTKLNFK